MNNSVGTVTGRSGTVGKSAYASQLASQERMFFDSGAPILAASAPTCERVRPLAIEQFGLRHLKTFTEIEKILHLREAIDLSVHSRAHTNFLALEKKETSAALSGRSNCAGKS